MRPQPHRLQWPLSPSQVEGIDEMFAILFKALRTGVSTSAATSASTSTSANAIGAGFLSFGGQDGDDGDIWPSRASNLQGFVPYVGATTNVNLGTNSLTTPSLLGGTAVGTSLALQSTTAVGTTDFIKFNVGTNGSMEAMRIAHSTEITISMGTTTPRAFCPLTLQAGTSAVALAIWGEATNLGYIQFFKNDQTTVEGSIHGTTGAIALAGPAGTDILTIKDTGTFTSTVIGGTGTGSTLSLQSTSGVGATDSIRFLVGNNGAAEIMRVDDASAGLLIGTTTGRAACPLTLQTGTSAVAMGIWGDASNLGYIQFFKNDKTTVEGSIHGATGLVAIAGPAGADVLTVNDTLVDAIAQFRAKSVRGTAVTFANRPATPVEGMLVAITDSTTVVWGATITGTGANHVLGYYNGTNWTVAGI